MTARITPHFGGSPRSLAHIHGDGSAATWVDVLQTSDIPSGKIGYAKGCFLQNLGASSAITAFYINTGSETSCTFSPLGPTDAATMTTATITTATIPNFVGAESHAGIITPAAGVAAGGGFSASPRLVHSGGVPAILTTSGTNSATNTGGTVYFTECFVPCNMSVTGIAIFNGTAVAGNGKVILYNSSGVKIAISASTAMSGTTAYQLIPLTGGPIAVVGPATYFIGATYDTSTHDLRGHVLGTFATGTLASTTYATDSTLTPIVPTTTFTADIGPIASLY